ncbi:hypothetical protein HK104_001793 [Borealophlyctis nickersoniae]|nr:hypothetical protein HK104_001793 [Borealophlyctis nickersoniae]
MHDFFISTPSQYAIQTAHTTLLPATAFPRLAISYALIFSLLYACTWHLVNHLQNPASAKPTQVKDLSTKSEEWANRLTSTLHALTACYGFVEWLSHDLSKGLHTSDQAASDPSHAAFTHSTLRDFYIGVTLGYLLFDLGRLVLLQMIASRVIAARRGENGKIDTAAVIGSSAPAAAGAGSMYLHHSVIIVAYSLGVRYQYGTYFLALFLNNEITTPFLNARFFLSSLNLKTHPIYVINDILFAALFFLDRIIGNAYILLSMQHLVATVTERDWEGHGVPWSVGVLLPVFAWIHGGLQVWWFGLIVRMVWRKFTAPPSSSSSSSPSVTPVDPPITNSPKSRRVLGLPENNVSGRVMKKLGLLEIANDKAAEVLGLRKESPGMKRRGVPGRN